MMMAVALVVGVPMVMILWMRPRRVGREKKYRTYTRIAEPTTTFSETKILSANGTPVNTLTHPDMMSFVATTAATAAAPAAAVTTMAGHTAMRNTKFPPSMDPKAELGFR
ncbi:unnamed protein product [Sphacelaria rigidula]